MARVECVGHSEKKFALFCLSRRHKKSGKKVAQRTKATKIGGFENRFFGRKYRFLEVCVGKPTGFVHDWVRHFFTHFFGGVDTGEAKKRPVEDMPLTRLEFRALDPFFF